MIANPPTRPLTDDERAFLGAWDELEADRAARAYEPASRIAHALRRVRADYPLDFRGQAMSLRAELLYSTFLSPEDRRAFRFEIGRRDNVLGRPQG